MTGLPRKTIEVAGFAAVLQRAIVMPTVSSEKRAALCWALENLLMSSGNYQGFRYVQGWKPDLPDFDGNLRTYYGVAFDEAGTVLDTTTASV